MTDKAYEIIDRFYARNGPCCAGCDWWSYFNSVAGECHRSAPVPGEQRVAMLGLRVVDLAPAAGHVMTLRDHHCGDFKEDYDWSTLPSFYLRRIDWTGKPTPAGQQGGDKP